MSEEKSWPVAREMVLSVKRISEVDDNSTALLSSNQQLDLSCNMGLTTAHVLSFVSQDTDKRLELKASLEKPLVTIGKDAVAISVGNRVLAAGVIKDIGL